MSNNLVEMQKKEDKLAEFARIKEKFNFLEFLDESIIKDNISSDFQNGEK